MSIDKEKNTVSWLNQQLEITKGLNADLNNRLAKLMSKTRFYKDLPIKDDYDRGFYKAFEIVELLLKGENIDT